MTREEKYAALCERVPELIDTAMARRAFFSALVIVPHHDLCKPFSEFLNEALIDAGYAIDKANSHMIRGDEIVVSISAASYLAGKGMSLHALVLPNEEPSASAQQKKIAKEYLDTIIAPMVTGPVIRY